MHQWQPLGDKNMDIMCVEEAEKIIRSEIKDYGVEEIPLETALGRVLAENLFADRDLPPFNRATVDGIAIDYGAYQKNVRSFKIKGTQAAGEIPLPITQSNECIEIMTGAALDHSVNTVIRYEDLAINGQIATIKNSPIHRGQNIHFQGKDKKQGDVVADAFRLITPALIGLAASVGRTKLRVKKLPRVVVITTGDELVDVETTPTPYQLRRSNGITIATVLQRYHIQADILHLNDDLEHIKTELARCLQMYDVLLMSGGVSMGKFDYIPQAFQDLGVKKLFHKVKQRPGKPFWFGVHENQTTIFAFPGNPLSVFMCLHRYFIPWLEISFQIKTAATEYAILQHDIHFPYPLQFFPQVKLRVDDQGQLWAAHVQDNGSGDFSNLIYTDAFMELPMAKNEFKKGDVYPIWRYRI